MALLHIYDSTDSGIRQTVGARTTEGTRVTLPISSVNDLLAQLDRLVQTRRAFDRVLFETHGSPGQISFGNLAINATWWRSVQNRNYTTLTTAGARVYFNGCNVAADNVGWAFLEAAASVWLTPGGGEIFGQTSLGFGNPFNGHVVHFWGSTRTLHIDRSGRVIERFEQ